MIKLIKYLLLIIFLLFITGCDEPTDHEKISFLTYNLFHIHTTKFNPIVQFPIAMTSRNERVPYQVNEIKKLSPTFVLIQEAFHKGSRQELVDLMEPEYSVINNDSRNIKYSLFKFGSGLLIFYKKSEVDYVGGSEIFKKFPNSISTFTESLLGQKGILYADFISKNGNRINVANTHLASLDLDGTIRLSQVKWLKEQLRDKNLIEKIDLQIIGGDLNTSKYNSDGSLQPPITALESAEHGGFPMQNIFQNHIENEKATWNRDNLLVELSKWPLSANEILDYVYINSISGKCSNIIKADIVINAKYPLFSLTDLIIEREENRNLAIEIIKDADPEILYALKKFRIRNGDNGWKWEKGASQYDPDESLRKAIDKLFQFESIDNKDLTDFDYINFDFEKNDDIYLSPLSDHYGVYGEAGCDKLNFN